MPSLIGDTNLQAAQALGQSGLTLAPTTQSVCSNTVKKGLVANTSPAPNASVKSGGVVTLIMSSGFCPVIVKNVIGEIANQAQVDLSAQGFQVGNVTTVSDPSCTVENSGTVFYQSLLPGSTQPYGSAVDLNVCP